MSSHESLSHAFASSRSAKSPFQKLQTYSLCVPCFFGFFSTTTPSLASHFPLSEEGRAASIIFNWLSKEYLIVGVSKIQELSVYVCTTRVIVCMRSVDVRVLVPVRDDNRQYVDLSFLPFLLSWYKHCLHNRLFSTLSGSNNYHILVLSAKLFLLLLHQ